MLLLKKLVTKAAPKDDTHLPPFDKSATDLTIATLNLGYQYYINSPTEVSEGKTKTKFQHIHSSVVVCLHDTSKGV